MMEPAPDPLNSNRFSYFHIFGAVMTIVGTTIGAGILGLPSLFSKSGYMTGVIVLLFLSLFFIYVFLLLGEAIMRTKEEHQLPGLAERYLGQNGKSWLFISMLLGSYGSLTAYLIASGEAILELGKIFFDLSGIFSSSLFYSIIFFLLMSILIIRGLNVIENSEIIVTGFLLLFVGMIFVIAFSEIDVGNVSLSTFSAYNLIIPYGAIFFSLMGFNSIPEAIRILHRRRSLVPYVLVAGVIVPVLAYIVFSGAIVGVMGANTNELGVTGLGDVLGPEVKIIANIFLIFAVTTSFLGIGFAQVSVFTHDYKMPRVFSWFLACGVPFLIFISIRNLMGFVNVLSITGSIFGAVMTGLIIVISYLAKKKGEVTPTYKVPVNLPIVVFLVMLLLGGMVTLFI